MSYQIKLRPAKHMDTMIYLVERVAFRSGRGDFSGSIGDELGRVGYALRRMVVNSMGDALQDVTEAVLETYGQSVTDEELWFLFGLATRAYGAGWFTAAQKGVFDAR